MSSKRHEILDDLMRFIEKSISMVASTNIGPVAKEEIAASVLDEVIKNWGGLNVYIPKNWLSQVSERKMAIYKSFDGNNHNDLAREFDLSVQYIYKIVKEVGAAERKKSQPDIFD